MAALDETASASIATGKESLAQLKKLVDVTTIAAAKSAADGAATASALAALQTSQAPIAATLAAMLAEQKRASRVAALQAGLLICEKEALAVKIDYLARAATHGGYSRFRAYELYPRIIRAALKGEGVYVEGSTSEHSYDVSKYEAGRADFHIQLLAALQSATGIKGRVEEQSDGRWAVFL